jgi:hypothetical protein
LLSILSSVSRRALPKWYLIIRSPKDGDKCENLNTEATATAEIEIFFPFGRNCNGRDSHENISVQLQRKRGEGRGEMNETKINFFFCSQSLLRVNQLGLEGTLSVGSCTALITLLSVSRQRGLAPCLATSYKFCHLTPSRNNAYLISRITAIRIHSTFTYPEKFNRSHSSDLYLKQRRGKFATMSN